MRPGNAEWQRDVALSYERVAVIEALQGARDGTPHIPPRTGHHRASNMAR
jgi:hypothetical protein